MGCSSSNTEIYKKEKKNLIKEKNNDKEQNKPINQNNLITNMKLKLKSDEFYTDNEIMDSDHYFNNKLVSSQEELDKINTIDNIENKLNDIISDKWGNFNKSNLGFLYSK